MRILLVEDEAEMADALASALKRYDMVVDHAPRRSRRRKRPFLPTSTPPSCWIASFPMAMVSL